MPKKKKIGMPMQLPEIVDSEDVVVVKESKLKPLPAHAVVGTTFKKLKWKTIPREVIVHFDDTEWRCTLNKICFQPNGDFWFVEFWERSGWINLTVWAE